MGSSGIALIGNRFRMSYARWRNRLVDSDSNRIVTNPGLLCKLSSRTVFPNILYPEPAFELGEPPW